jgi:ABC-type transport system substrate-binding protein
VLPTFSLELLWLVTRGSRLADPGFRQEVFSSVADRGGLPSFVPSSMPGAETVLPRGVTTTVFSPLPLRLTLAYTEQDVLARRIVPNVREVLAQDGIETTLKPVRTLRELLRLAGPPAQPGIDLVLLGWSAEFFDAYNVLDLFPCGSAFNVAKWCDRSYDRLMAQAVRTLDDEDRWRIERRLVTKLDRAIPAIPVSNPSEHVFLKPGVRGFRWSPIGFYELMGMTRS